MKAIYVKKGNDIDHIPTANVAAGDVVPIGPDLLGMAKLDIKAEGLGALSLVGVFDMPKETGGGKDIEAGENVYWDIANQIVSTEDSKQFLGKAIAAAGENDETVRVRLVQ